MKKNLSKILGASISKLAKKLKPPFVSAVILAGGRSERMGRSKQLIPICGIPVVARSAISFEKCPDISEIIIVCRKDERDAIAAMVKEYGITKFKCFAEAGKTRTDSVKSGFEKTLVSGDIVAVHDAARCLITPEMISNVVSAAKKNGAAIAASRTIDTVKTVDDNGLIKSTVPRAESWNAQTPQAFFRPLLEVGLYYPRDDGFMPTDDAMLVETLGFRVSVVDCGYENMKITTPLDVPTAEAILKKRSEDEK